MHTAAPKLETVQSVVAVSPEDPELDNNRVVTSIAVNDNIDPAPPAPLPSRHRTHPCRAPAPTFG